MHRAERLKGEGHFFTLHRGSTRDLPSSLCVDTSLSLILSRRDGGSFGTLGLSASQSQSTLRGIYPVINCVSSPQSRQAGWQNENVPRCLGRDNSKLENAWVVDRALSQGAQAQAQALHCKRNHVDRCLFRQIGVGIDSRQQGSREGSAWLLALPARRRRGFLSRL